MDIDTLNNDETLIDFKEKVRNLDYRLKILK